MTIRPSPAWPAAFDARLDGVVVWTCSPAAAEESQRERERERVGGGEKIGGYLRFRFAFPKVSVAVSVDRQVDRQLWTVSRLANDRR